MNIFKKIKYEITLFFLVILAIIAFFIYGRVLEVQQLQVQTEVNNKVIESLEGIEKELAKGNCIALASSDEEREACN